MLYIICSVCSTPRALHPSQETGLLKATHLLCLTCKQTTEITEEIRNHIKKERGIV